MCALSSGHVAAPGRVIATPQTSDCHCLSCVALRRTACWPVALSPPSSCTATCTACCSHYEELYGEALPLEEAVQRSKQEQLQEQIQRLIAKKKPPAGGGAGARGPAPAKPAISGGSRAGRGPSRLVNPVSTMPGQKASQNWISSGRPLADGGMHGRHPSDENEHPAGSRRPPVPPLQLPTASAAQQQEDGRAAGRLWRPQEAVRSGSMGETPRHGGPATSGMPGSPSCSLTTSRGTSGFSHLGAAAPVLMRQIELKAALRPPSEELPHKSPWRPPGEAAAECSSGAGGRFWPA